MRLIGRLIALLLILLLAWPWVKTYVVAAVDWFSEDITSQRTDVPVEADQETVFWLDSERWMRFSLTESASTVRILTHLQIPSDQIDPESETVIEGGNLYGFEYRLLDSRGQEIYANQHYFRASLLPPRRLEDGTEFPTRFYDDVSMVASAAENLFYGLEDGSSAAAVEIRVIEKPTEDNRVGIQVSEEQTRPREDAARLWPRMAPETQQGLLRPHVYPTHLVSPYEIENGLMSRWMPLGPEGVEGTDFSGDFLYSLDVPPSPPRGANDVVPEGLYADPNHWVTLPIAETGRYRLELEPVNGNVGDFSATMAHQDNDNLQIQQSVLDGQSPMIVWTGAMKPGLVQLIPAVPVAVRLFDEETGDELTPDANYLRADTARPGAPVAFLMDPNSERGQAVRLDVRTFTHPQLAESGTNPEVVVSVKGLDGEVISRYTRNVNPPASYHQRFSGQLAEARVSEANSLFLEVPSEAAELEVASNTPVLITGYARMDGQPLVRDLPDQSRPWQGYENRMPSWFLMQPMNTPDQGQRVALQWFFKPIERSAAIISGRYEWEALEPTRNSLIREVLFPYSLDGELRKTAVGSVYRALPDSEVTLSLVAPEKNVPFRPELVYQRSSSGVEEITVYRDGRVWLSRKIAGRSGRFSMPVTEAGQYRIRVKGSGQWYLNHTAPPEGTGYLERSTVSMVNASQAFTIEKRAAQEVANLEMIAPSGVDSYSVTVRIAQADRDDGLLPEYSFFDRRYNVQVSDRKTLMLGSQSGALASPVTVGVPLGEDLPPGRYRIEVATTQPGILLSAYVLREGQSQGYRFFRRSLDGY